MEKTTECRGNKSFQIYLKRKKTREREENEMSLQHFVSSI